MNSEPDSLRVKQVFEKAIEFTSTGERQGYLNGTCNGDSSLLGRVQTLLRAHFEHEESFLPGQPAAVPAPLHSARNGEKPGAIIGRYKLLQKIGEGGCGVVWMAEQEEPVRRRVALKIIKLGMDTRSVIARFEAERQALALMDHPNIARVLDAGSTDTGRPYFVMELVRGVRLTTYCDQQKLAIRARLELFIKVCQAIQHAHQKGIIHRDIKPSNILVTLHDGVPVPKVIDFGIAKATDRRLTDKTLFTQYDAFIGTPAYMSPEQAEMSGLDIDTRTDIYSLGVLLYELLIGVTPFDAQTLAQLGLDEMRRMIREDEPKRPSTRLGTFELTDATAVTSHRREKLPALALLLRGDLDWIVMKCLEKDRTRRYESATGLAADVLRHLNNEAIVARPPTAGYRLHKAVRRNKLAFGAAAAVFAVLVLGILAASWQAMRAKNAERAARLAEQSERKQSESARTDRDRAIRAEAAALTELENARAALAFIRDDLLGQASPDRQPNPNLTVRELLDNASASFEQRKSLPPKVEASIRQTIGSINLALGEYRTAISHLSSALTVQRQQLGPAHEETLRTLHLLSETHWGHGDDIEAVELARQGLELSRGALGERHEMTLHFLADVAIAPVYGEVETADNIDRGLADALRAIRDALGDTDKLAFRLKVAIGARQLFHGKYAEAESTLAQAIDRQRSVLREMDPLMLEAMSTLARTYAYQKRYDQAEALERRVLDSRRSLLGPDHAMTVNIEVYQACRWLTAGDLPEANRVHHRLLALLGRGRLIESRMVVRSLATLIGLYRSLAQWEKIDELGTAVVTASRKQLEEESIKVLTLRDEWARSLVEQRRYADAEPHFRSSIEIRAKQTRTYARFFSAMSRLGECLYKLNRDHNEAERLLKDGYEGVRQHQKNLPATLRLEILGSALWRLADFYDGTGRPESAAEHRRKLAELEQVEGRPYVHQEFYLIF